MKISLNWLKDYVDIDLTVDQIADTLTAIGLEVEGIEVVEQVKGGLEGIVVGIVKECQQHPNADRLSLTKVNIGNGEDLQIVCGAPNVAAGQKVLVAPIGTTLYDKEGKDWTIKKGKIRGEASEGMICAEDELGLGDDHSGIIVLPDEVPPGTSARDYYQISTDTVFEIGLTPNRSDATCHIGVAKDLVAALKINHGHSGQVKRPSVENFTVDNRDLQVEVIVENTVACPRYSGVSIQGVTIRESPDWLKHKLRAIGVRPISNIVDITNFVLHELGQPLHAFDLDQIAQRQVRVKTLPKGSQFTSLDEVLRTLDEEDLMICDGNSRGMCIGGVFGGINSGVKEKTRNIFLESAHFDPGWIRRTSTRHQLRTDAARIYEKGSDPNVTVYALKRAAMLIKELGGGTIASEVVDVYPDPILPRVIDVAYRKVNRLIGVEIAPEEVQRILEAMEMNIVSSSDEGFSVAVPTNKADVLREADVIEEVLRIYGLNKVPIPTQIRTAVGLPPDPDPVKVRNRISEQLTGSGLTEIMSLSLNRSVYYEEILPMAQRSLVLINNTSNKGLDVMRPTMLFSGLEAILYNQNRQASDLAFYEFGRIYRKAEEEDDIIEKEHLALFLTGRQQRESWLDKRADSVSYYSLKTLVNNVLLRMGVEGYQETALQSEVFNYGMRYHRGPRTLVELGKVDQGILKKMDIRQEVFYADFHWDAVFKAHKKHKVDFVELTKYPSVRRDLALVIENSVHFQDIARVARKIGKSLLKDINLFDVYENEEQLGADKKSYAVSFVFENPNKTLEDKEVEKIMKKLIYIYENDLGAVIRR